MNRRRAVREQRLIQAKRRNARRYERPVRNVDNTTRAARDCETGALCSAVPVPRRLFHGGHVESTKNIINTTRLYAF